MKKAANWKDTYRAGVYASVNLRRHKIHRDLLAYLVHSANQRVKFCWPTQHELANVCDCSIRNVHGLLDYLHEIGAVFPVRYADLPKSTQALIKSLTPNKVTRNSNAYYLSVGWAKDVLAGDEDVSEISDGLPSSNLTTESRRKGSLKANARRQRYRPIDTIIEVPIGTNADHDDWQIINAVPGQSGSPTSVSKTHQAGSGATDMTTEYNQAANSTPNNGRVNSFGILPSKAEQAERLISSLPHQHGETCPHGYGVGEASACVPRPQALVAEGSEQEAARACGGDRRAS